MQQRDLIALLMSIVLGVGSCFLISHSGVGAAGALLMTLLFCPLITSAVAGERIFLLGLAPNIVIASGVSIMGASSPYNRTAAGGLSDETWFIVPILFALGIACALVMAGVVWFVRKEIL